MLAKRYGTFIPTRFDYDSANLAVRNRSAQAELGQKTLFVNYGEEPDAETFSSRAGNCKGNLSKNEESFLGAYFTSSAKSAANPSTSSGVVSQLHMRRDSSQPPTWV